METGDFRTGGDMLEQALFPVLLRRLLRGLEMGLEQGLLQ